MIEIGCMDIDIEVSLLSSHSAMLRQANLEAALHIMGYMKIRHDSRLRFDISNPYTEDSNFQDCDLTDFYEGALEVIPPNAPPSRRKEIDLSVFVDSDHTGDKQTRRIGLCS